MAEQACAFHPDRLTRVSCSRCERPICPDDMFPAPVGIHCPICAGKMREGALGKTGYQVRARVEGNRFGRMLVGAQLTQVILAANVIVFVLMLGTGRPTSGKTLYDFGALPGILPASQWWRLFTAMFVHIGIVHIAFNMFALTIFGGAIEQRYGKVRFLGLYVLAGLLGSVSSLALSHATLSAGASGAIFGIMGAWLILALTHPAMRDQIRSWSFLIGVNIFFSITANNIDLWAHLGGLLGGILIATGVEMSVRVKKPARLAVMSAGFVIVATLVVAIAAANVV
jgi:membrane associated rhomboid family serine protease